MRVNFGIHNGWVMLKNKHHYFFYGLQEKNSFSKSVELNHSPKYWVLIMIFTNKHNFWEEQGKMMLVKIWVLEGKLLSIMMLINKK